jgi:hypothetical protein
MIPLPERPPLHIPRWLWNAIMGFLGLTALAACGSNNPTPLPLPPPVIGGSGWQITHSSTPVPQVVNDGFDFPVCAPNANSTWVSYFELPFTRDISQAASMSVTYTLNGTNSPTFDHSTPNNVSTGAAMISLLLHRAGDDLSGAGSMAYYRWFGPILHDPPVYPLDFGTHIVTVPLTLTSWGSLADQQQQWFDLTRSNMGWIGVVFGGGDFYSHGVCMATGTAHFHLDGYAIQ